MPSKKYFIAIIIPEPIQAEIEFLKQELLENHGLKGALRSPAHITLHRPFEWKENKENSLVDKLKSFVFPKNFEIRLQNFSAFEPRVIFVDVAPNPELAELHKTLRGFAMKELQLMNEFEDRRGFHPHVTISFRDLKKNKFPEIWKGFEKREMDAKFNCDGFSLLKLSSRWEEHARINF